MSNKPIQIVKDEFEKYVIVSKEYCEKVIKKLCIVSSSSATIEAAYVKDKDYYKFNYNKLRNILLNLNFKKSLGPDQDERNYVVNTLVYKLPYYSERHKLLKKCYELKNKYNNIAEFLGYIFSDEEKMMEVLELLSEFVQIDNDFFYLVDLIAAKDDMIKNLNYMFNDENIVSAFKTQYDLAINDMNVAALKDLLESTQGLILKHWEEYLTNIDDYKSGEPFSFLCHSLSGSMFEGNFRTNIVSMSLITDKFHHTFCDECGFILPPTNIVAADSRDMYINNYADDDERILYYSTIKRISPPERLIAEDLKWKEKNRNFGEDEVVYSEVAKRGFDPIAIFCLTDGSKKLDENYVNAYLLQEKFPHLKVIEIDKTLYDGDKKDFLELVTSVICKLKTIINGENYYANSHDVGKSVFAGTYDAFWHEFMELKKHEFYTEVDIISLFEKYENLIDDSKDIDEAFKILNKEELEYYLKYNETYGVGSVLYGKPKDYFNGLIKFELSELDKIYNNFKPYQDDKRLDEFIPGLVEFLHLYGNISVDELCDDAKLKICNSNSFVDINYILMFYLKKKDLEKLGYSTENNNLDNSNYVEELNSSVPEILDIEEAINSKAKDIMDYIKACGFLENIDCSSQYYMCQSTLGFINYNNEELAKIATKKETIKASNSHIDSTIESLQKDREANLMKIKKLYKKRLKNGVAFDKLLYEEEQVKANKARQEDNFNYYKIKFNNEVGVSYDDYVHMLDIAHRVSMIINNLVADKKAFDKQLMEILAKFDLSIGLFQDYVENYYNNGHSGLTM